MTQHLSRLQPGRRRFSQPRSLLPPKHMFILRFRAEPRAGAGAEAGSGRAGLRAANGGYSPLPSSLLPRLSLGARSGQQSPSRTRTREPAGHRAPGQGLVAEAVSGVAGLGASHAGAPTLASAGRGGQTGAISRAARGSGGGGCCAPGGRREEGGGAGGGGRGGPRAPPPRPRSRPLSAWTPLAGKPQLPVQTAQLARTPRLSPGVSPAGTRTRSPAGPWVLFLLPHAQEPVAKGHGARRLEAAP